MILTCFAPGGHAEKIPDTKEYRPVIVINLTSGIPLAPLPKFNKLKLTVCLFSMVTYWECMVMHAWPGLAYTWIYILS